MFDSTHENPELIWNEDVRMNVMNVVSSELEQLNSMQQLKLDTKWKAVCISSNNSLGRGDLAKNSLYFSWQVNLLHIVRR